jgi:hypothetical protein
VVYYVIISLHTQLYTQVKKKRTGGSKDKESVYTTYEETMPFSAQLGCYSCKMRKSKVGLKLDFP